MSANVCSGTCYETARSCANKESCSCTAPQPEPFRFFNKFACGAVATYVYHKSTGGKARRRALDELPNERRWIAPCNASYVSYACSQSPDGIVQEPLENWLGAVMPEDATEIPMIPQEWLTIHNLPANYHNPSSWTPKQKRDVEIAEGVLRRKFGLED